MGKKVLIKEIILGIDIIYSSLEPGFIPTEDDSYLLKSSLFDEEDDYRLFILGDDLKIKEEERLYFPLLSHA